MRARRLIGALFSAVVATGCLQSTVLVRINGDGSGTIENQTLMAPAALAQMRQLAGLFGGTDARPVDPFSEQQMRDLAAQMGDGVTLLSTRPLKTATGEGREAIYGFRDITKVRVSETPVSPGNTSVRAGGISIGGAGQGGAVTMDFTRTPGGNALLTLHTPVDPLSGVVDQFGSATRRGSPVPADQMAMMRQMLSGLRVALRVEPAGRLVRTSSPYVDGQTVTLFEIDIDALLNDEAAFSRLQNAKTASEAADALKSVPGIKFNRESETTIEFVP